MDTKKILGIAALGGIGALGYWWYSKSKAAKGAADIQKSGTKSQAQLELERAQAELAALVASTTSVKQSFITPRVGLTAGRTATVRGASGSTDANMANLLSQYGLNGYGTMRGAFR